MRIGYCDCFSGISGDMFLGALVDAGLPVGTLEQELQRLGLPEKYRITASQVKKGAISSCLVRIDIENETLPDPDAEIPESSIEVDENEHRHDVPHHHEHEHAHEVARDQKDSGSHSHHSHSHQRSFADIADLIERSPLSRSVKATSLAIFQKLASAEAKIHAQRPEDVHFHEVGAVDSILDIVGAAIGLEYLGIERLYASALPFGSGQVNSQHGLLPIPAPATLDLMRQAQVPVVPSPARKELVTPTGAAILATLATFDQPAMRITGVGTGAGQRELSWPNVMRLVIGETGSSGDHGDLVLIETNIDDMAGQGFGQVMSKLFSAGALDVFFTPIYMKKNRPATMLSVIAPRLHEPELAQIILKETTTFGMRVQPTGRYEAQREMRKVSTPYGEIDVKLKILDGKVFQAVPEYETCLRIASEHDVPFLNVYQAALSAGADFF